MTQRRSGDPSIWGLPRWLVTGGITLLVTLVYLQVLGFDFVYDDHHFIVANGFLRVPSDVFVLFSREAVARNVLDAFRPTSVLFEMAVYQVVGLHTVLQHAVSLLLHILVMLLAERWLLRLRVPALPRFGATALFGVMAVHAEAVAVVSYREDLLAAALGLGALVYIDAKLDAGHPMRAVVGGTVLQALAVGAKLSAAPLPAVYVLSHLLRPFDAPRMRWPLGLLALTLGTAAAIAHRLWLFGSLASYEGDPTALAISHVSRAEVLAASAQIHLHYLQRLVLPFGLSPEYVDFGAAWHDPATIVSVLALASLALYAAGLAVVRRRPVIVWTIACSFALALPTANFVAMPNMQADRFLYLTSLPVAVGLAHGLFAVGRRFSEPFLLLPIAIALIWQGSIAQATTAVYRSDTRLWSIALLRAPHSARAHAAAGELLVLRELDDRAKRQHLLAKARGHCTIAVRRAPRDPLASFCAARLAVLERDWPRAQEAFARALDGSALHRQRALVALASTSLDLPDLSDDERWSRALSYLEPALAAYPYVAEVAAVGGRLHHRWGHPEIAARLFARAAALHPERWDFVVSRVELALDLGDASAAQGIIKAAGRRWRDVPEPIRAAMAQRLASARRELSGETDS